MKIFFRVLSYFTHPLFLTSFLVLIYYTFTPESFHMLPRSKVYPIVVLNTLVFPLLTVLILKGLGWVKSIYLKTQSERILPLMASMTFYFWAFYVSKNQQFDEPLQVLLLAGFINLLVLVLMGTAMKPSMHMSSWAMATLWLWHIYQFGFGIFLWISIASLVMTIMVYIARYSLGAHDPKELNGGMLSGIISLVIALLVYFL